MNSSRPTARRFEKQTRPKSSKPHPDTILKASPGKFRVVGCDGKDKDGAWREAESPNLYKACQIARAVAASTGTTMQVRNHKGEIVYET